MTRHFFSGWERQIFDVLRIAMCIYGVWVTMIIGHIVLYRRDWVRSFAPRAWLRMVALGWANWMIMVVLIGRVGYQVTWLTYVFTMSSVVFYLLCHFSLRNVDADDLPLRPAREDELRATDVGAPA